jgi:hypothetical protein
MDEDTSTTAYSTKATRDWTEQDVADWMRKVVTSSAISEAGRIALDKSLNIVMQQAINGAALLLFKDEAHLQLKLRLLDGHALIIWAEIQKMNKSLAEPDKRDASGPATNINEVFKWNNDQLADWTRSKIGDMNWPLEVDQAFRASKLTGSLLEQLSITSADDVSRLIPNIPAPTTEAIWQAFREHILATSTQSLEKFIVDSQKARSPLSEADQCSLCKLPLEPKKTSLPAREALKYSVDTASNRHWFCLPTESIFDRETAMKQLQDALNNNIKVSKSRTKQDHIFCTAIGFVGIGKTTVGQYIASKLQIDGKPVKYIYIDFSNGDRIDKLQQADSKSFARELALRIITRLFKDHSYEHAYERFPEQLKRLKDSIEVHATAMTLTQILETWLKHHADEYAAVVLHFDEINYLTDNAREYLIAYIGAAMVPQSDASNISTAAKILPLLTGTTESTRNTIKLSKFGHVPVSLAALSDDAQYALVLSTVGDHLRLKLQEDNKFKMVIKSTLGVPRLVMQLRRAVLEETRVPGATHSWSELLKATAKKFLNYVSQTYSISTWQVVFPSKVLILRLICVCLRGKFESVIEKNEKEEKIVATITVPGIDEKMTHIPGMSISVRDLRDDGFIHTSEKGDVDGQVDILMPYSLLSSLICSAPSYEPIQSSIIAPISNLTWQELEELELNFLKLFVSAFNAMGANLSVKFRDIWRGAVAQEDILGMKIKIPSSESFCCGKEANQWISKELTISKPLPYVKLDSNELINLEHKNGVFLACANNPLFDVRSKFEIDVPTIQAEENLPFEPVPSEENPKQRRIGSETGPNKAAKSVTKTNLLNLVQMKASADPKAKITASKIYAWYMDAQKLKFPEKYKVVFTYFTNKNMQWDIKELDDFWSKDKLLDSCPNLVLMAREQLVTYLSPMFAPLCQPKD